jgi:hypothetical protein
MLQPGREPCGSCEAVMLDLIYLATGAGVFALFAAYALGLRRI